MHIYNGLTLQIVGINLTFYLSSLQLINNVILSGQAGCDFVWFEGKVIGLLLYCLIVLLCVFVLVLCDLCVVSGAFSAGFALS